MEAIKQRSSNNTNQYLKTDNDVIAFLKSFELVDTAYYRTMYPDIRDAGIDPVAHFVLQGWKEDRNPNVWFNTGLYRSENQDIEQNINPLLHYIFEGYAEGRRPNVHCSKKSGRMIVSISPNELDYDTIYPCIASLLNQSYKPDKIIVYMNSGSLRDKHFCMNFEDLLDCGVEIRWTEDFGLYTSFFAAANDFANDLILICSPRFEYKNNFIEDIFNQYSINKKDIICGMISRASMEYDNLVIKFGDNVCYEDASFMNIPHYEFGMLFKPGFFNSIAYDYASFIRFAPKFPDLWYWIMAIASGRKIRTVNNNLPNISNLPGLTAQFCSCMRSQIDDIEQELISLMYHYQNRLNDVIGKGIYDELLKKNVVKRYENWTGHKIDIKKCDTFNEKIQLLKVYDNLPIKTQLADKYLVRDYIRREVGEKYLIPILGVWQSFDEIDFDKLPEQFVLKTNHASGQVMIVKDKSRLDMAAARSQFNQWLKEDFSIKCWEMQYANIPPLILAEEYLGDNVNDYKFLCHHGQVDYILVDMNRFIGHKRNIYTPDWIPQNIQMGFPNAEKDVPMPAKLAEMLDLASRLSKPFRHLRVDLFFINEQIKLGELTFSHGAGYESCLPDIAAKIIGKTVDLTNFYTDIDRN